jgi:hypothetical protein
MEMGTGWYKSLLALKEFSRSLEFLKEFSRSLACKPEPLHIIDLTYRDIGGART